jgi:hypothetical protein
MPTEVATQGRDILVIAVDAGALDPLIGTYPPKYQREDERRSAYAQWAKLLSEARALRSSIGDSEPVLALLANLYRQGHNIGVSGSGSEADSTITECVNRFPTSVLCHTAAIDFYLQVDPETGKKAERSLSFLREHYAPELNSSIEGGYVFFYLYQQRNAEALKQIDTYLASFPRGKDRALFEALRPQLKAKGIEIVRK